MSPRDEWHGTYERLKYEGRKFREMSKSRRKEAADLRKQRRWLDALTAMDRCHEYRDTANQYLGEAKQIKDRWGFR